jgi:aspartate-semialdehyde dehydrogenase
MTKQSYSVALVGATGLVGGEIVTALEERGFPLAALQAYASVRSAGDEVRCAGLFARVELIDRARFSGVDLVVFAAGEQIAAEWAPRFADAGAVVIDTSALYGDDPAVPLVVPEVNAADLAGYTERRIVASPDAPAIALAVALHPLHAASTVLRAVVSTFEPVSGAGRLGVEVLEGQTRELMHGRSLDLEPDVHRTAFNVVPHVGEFLAGGVTRDEAYTAVALRRLLDSPDLLASITRVRVPSFFGTGVSVSLELGTPLSAAAARDLLRGAPGLHLYDDDGSVGRYPTPVDAVGQDAVCVGRLRVDEDRATLDCWLAVDNIRKGAAVNAVQIAELLARDYL